MERIQLREDQVIGQGGHKKVYIDPRDEKKCIKILLEGRCQDWDREKKYREIRAARGQHSIMLPKYYGEVETNQGKGYVFERVVDYNGETSQDLGEYIRLKGEVDPQVLEYTVKQFFYGMLAEKIIVTNAEYTNFLVQRVSPTFQLIRVVDNIGSHSRLLFDCYLDRVADNHIKRYYLRLLHEVDKDFSHLISRELFQHLEDFIKNF